MSAGEDELRKSAKELEEERQLLNKKIEQLLERKIQAQDKYDALSESYPSRERDAPSWSHIQRWYDAPSWDSLKIYDDIKNIELSYRWFKSDESDADLNIRYLQLRGKNSIKGVTPKYVDAYKKWNNQTSKFLSEAMSELDEIERKLNLLQKEVSEKEHATLLKNVMDETYEEHLRETQGKSVNTESDSEISSQIQESSLQETEISPSRAESFVKDVSDTDKHLEESPDQLDRISPERLEPYVKQESEAHVYPEESPHQEKEVSSAHSESFVRQKSTIDEDLQEIFAMPSEMSPTEVEPSDGHEMAHREDPYDPEFSREKIEQEYEEERATEDGEIFGSNFRVSRFVSFEEEKMTLINLLEKEEVSVKDIQRSLQKCINEAEKYIRYDSRLRSPTNHFLLWEAYMMRGILNKNLKDPETFIQQQHAMIRHVFVRMPFLTDRSASVIKTKLVEAFQKRLEKYAAPSEHLSSEERDHRHNVVAMIQSEMVSQGMTSLRHGSEHLGAKDSLSKKDDLDSVITFYKTYQKEKDTLYEKNTHFQKMQMTSLHLTRSLHIDTVKRKGKPSDLQRLFEGMEKKIGILSHANNKGWATYKESFLDNVHDALLSMHRDLSSQEGAQDEKLKEVLDTLTSLDPHSIYMEIKGSKDKSPSEMEVMSSFMEEMRSKIDNIKSDAQDVLKEVFKDIEKSQKKVRDAYSAYRTKSKDSMKNYRTLEDITKKEVKDVGSGKVKEVGFFSRLSQFIAQGLQGIQERLGIRSAKAEGISVDLLDLSPSEHVIPSPIVDLDSVFSQDNESNDTPHDKYNDKPMNISQDTPKETTSHDQASAASRSVTSDLPQEDQEQKKSPHHKGP